MDTRRTKTNRRVMVRDRYGPTDFDFALVYLADLEIFYVLPVDVFLSYKSGASLVETTRRQRKPRSAGYRDAWELIAGWAVAHAKGSNGTNGEEFLVRGN